MENVLKIHCSIWNFFKNIKGTLKHVRVTLCRTDALHHCNRLLVCLNSKFDELKECSWVRIEKKCVFWNGWNFFSNVKQTLKKVRLNSYKTDILYFIGPPAITERVYKKGSVCPSILSSIHSSLCPGVFFELYH